MRNPTNLNEFGKYAKRTALLPPLRVFISGSIVAGGMRKEILNAFKGSEVRSVDCTTICYAKSGEQQRIHAAKEKASW